MTLTTAKIPGDVPSPKGRKQDKIIIWRKHGKPCKSPKPDQQNYQEVRHDMWRDSRHLHTTRKGLLWAIPALPPSSPTHFAQAMGTSLSLTWAEVEASPATKVTEVRQSAQKSKICYIHVWERFQDKIVMMNLKWKT